MSSEQADVCQIRGCHRSATGRYTRRMYDAQAGEEWPDDVCDRPVCWRHWFIEEAVRYGIAGGMLGFMAVVSYEVIPLAV